MTSGEYVVMQVSRYRKPIILWLAGAVICVIGLALIFWPERDLDLFRGSSKVQNIEIDLQTRRVEADIRHYRSEGLTDDQIKKKLVTTKNVNSETVDSVFEYLENRDSDANGILQHNSFATIILAPPIWLLELGAVWLFALGLRAWRNKRNKDQSST